MRKFLLVCFLLLSFFLKISPDFVKAQNPESNLSGFTEVQEPTYFTGVTEKIIEQQMIDQEKELYIQTATVKRDDTGEVVTVTIGSEFQPLNKTQLLTPGRKVVLAEQQITLEQREVVLADIYRLPTVVGLSILFVIIVLVVGGLQGLGAISGMAISIFILVKFIVPHILAGENPIVISLLGCVLIGGLTLYISHGFTVKSHVALASMMAALLVVSLLSYISVESAQLVGLGQEEAYFLQFGDTAKINLQGLLLGGIMLGALGVLDDITVSQVSVVFQLRAAKKEMEWRELYQRGLVVGKDHVASLVNTLVLAYAGANLPLFLLFMLNERMPQWVSLNSEIIVEEIIRTLTGSIGLVLAVPLATLLAARVAVGLSPKKIDEMNHHGHSH